jgi:hypothetical protein
MRRAGLPILLAFLLAIPVTGSVEQEKKSSKKQTAGSGARIKSGDETRPEKKRPDEIASFIDNVRSAPPEFAADLLIRLAESDRIADPVWKQELLEEAFRTSQQAQQPYKRVYTSRLYPLDTRSGYLGYAFDLKLDALSLQCRAVNALLKIDKQKARALFAEIPRLNPKPINCEDSLVYDLSDFYSTLADVARTTFTPKEIARKNHLMFAEPYISGMVSPIQIVPVINAILSLQVPAPDLETLVYTFSNALRNIADDDRAFLYVGRSSLKAILELLSRCREQAVPADDIVIAYRAYLLKQLNGHRCADTYEATRKELSRLLSSFDDDVRPHSVKNVLPLSSEEIKPTRIAGEEKAYFYWQTSKAIELLDGIRHINFGGGNKEVNDEIKQSADWQAEVENFLKDLANWRKEDERSDEDYFHQKSLLYKGLLGSMPQCNARDEVLRSYVAFLNEFDLHRGSRIEWFWHAGSLIGIDPHLKPAATVSPVEAQMKYLEKLSLTRNPLLFLYVEWKKLSLAAPPSS